MIIASNLDLILLVIPFLILWYIYPLHIHFYLSFVWQITNYKTIHHPIDQLLCSKISLNHWELQLASSDDYIEEAYQQEFDYITLYDLRKCRSGNLIVYLIKLWVYAYSLRIDEVWDTLILQSLREWIKQCNRQFYVRWNTKFFDVRRDFISQHRT